MARRRRVGRELGVPCERDADKTLEGRTVHTLYINWHLHAFGPEEIFCSFEWFFSSSLTEALCISLSLLMPVCFAERPLEAQRFFAQRPE